MATGADIIDKACKKLLSGIPKLSDPLKELLPNIQSVTEGDSTEEEREDVARVLAIGFFTTQAARCLPLIAETMKALAKLPPATPPSAKIQRKWLEDINKKLRTLQSQTFPQLEANINTFYTVPEPATKISALTSIVGQLPSIVQSFVVMTANLVKTRMALKI